jgi:hypothetical protein
MGVSLSWYVLIDSHQVCNSRPSESMARSANTIDESDKALSIEEKYWANGPKGEIQKRALKPLVVTAPINKQADHGSKQQCWH